MALQEPWRETHLRTLAEQYAAGHLRPATLEHRVDLVLRARTVGELDEALWDLPPLQGSRWQALLDRVAPRRGGVRPCTRIVFCAARRPIELSLRPEAQTWSIGRSRRCDVVLDDPAISRRHAVLSVRGGHCAIRDLGSMNGTEINGRASTAAVLHPGDAVRLGRAVTAHVR